MEKIKFERNKHGKELLMDACNEHELELVADIMVLNFYTIVLLEKCTGTYFPDTDEIPFRNNTILFVKPGQINKVDKAVFEKCHLLFFEGDFLDEFFNDKEFIFKFGFFHNNESPSSLYFDDAGAFNAFNQIAFEIWEEIKNLTQDSHHILRTQIYYLLVKLHRAYSQRYGQGRDTMSDPVVRQFSRLLDKEVRKQPECRAICRASKRQPGTPEQSLSKIFFQDCPPNHPGAHHCRNKEGNPIFRKIVFRNRLRVQILCTLTFCPLFQTDDRAFAPSV